ncbi:serine--tRNA ligase, chloroplastic/mitochondrial isoform X2 [Rhizophagus clarus]|uniref:serine--tRNA ligase n=1 Tax=Rhizophagus clarus TaxID=94130 RepID=A0A8H3LH90_9GLOM|nr:serine--tRNA ligase, chloroplastic/mitochondrial isoform X2 [Rhizophagus clarus]
MVQYLKRSKKLKQQIQQKESKLIEVEKELLKEALKIPNDTHFNTPIEFKFNNFDQASNVTGTSWYYLMNEGALLELALIQYATAEVPLAGLYSNKILSHKELPIKLDNGYANTRLGASTYRKYDMEAWMPGRGKWGEISSASNCTDYQSRRLSIRYKSPSSNTTEFAHTLNGTAVAIPRLIIAILENFQKDDGKSVVIPAVLRKWMGNKDIINFN